MGRSFAIVLAVLIASSFMCGPADAARRHGYVAKWRGPAKWRPLAPFVPDVPGPWTLRDAQVEPIGWGDIDGWSKDDHAAAFAAFLASCQPIARTAHPAGENRPMYGALHAVCGRALRAGAPRTGARTGEAGRKFFEENFRPVRITKLGDSAGFLTGYYEPIVDGSRFPTGIYHVPIYRRPPDLLPPAGATGSGFPNTGQSRRRNGAGELVPYHDRAAIEDGVLDGQHLEICWIKDPTDALFIQIQGSARVRLEDGLMVRINYDSHNGFPYTPVGRILIERNLVPRDQMSMDRIRDWIRANPDGAKELRRQNRSFVFFRIVGLGEDHDALGAQGLPLTAGRSIAVDKGLHVYGTPFFIEADLPIESAKAATPFRRLMVAQDTGSAIVGPARADLYWGAGDQAGRIAGRVRQAGKFTMLIPREIDPVEAGARMPMPLPRPVRLIAAQHQPKVAIAAPKGAAPKGMTPKGAAAKAQPPTAQPPAAQPPTPQRVRGSRRHR